jgi:hypothetical protein
MRISGRNPQHFEALSCQLLPMPFPTINLIGGDVQKAETFLPLLMTKPLEGSTRIRDAADDNEWLFLQKELRPLHQAIAAPAARSRTASRSPSSLETRLAGDNSFCVDSRQSWFGCLKSAFGPFISYLVESMLDRPNRRGGRRCSRE